MAWQGVLRLVDSDGWEDTIRNEPLHDWKQLMPKLCSSLAAAARLQRLMIWDYVESPVALTGKTKYATSVDRFASSPSLPAGWGRVVVPIAV